MLKEFHWKCRFSRWTTQNRVDFPVIRNVTSEIAAVLIANQRKQRSMRRLLCIFPLLTVAEGIYDDLTTLKQSFDDLFDEILLVPEIVDNKKFMLENESKRTSAYHLLANSTPDITLASVAGLLTPVPSPEIAKRDALRISMKHKIKYSELIKRLVELDYDDEYEVTIPGEFARRGSIIDIFSPSSDQPARLEFWGEELDTLRAFSAASQCSTGELDEYEVVPRMGVDLRDTGFDFYSFFEHVEHDVFVFFPEQINHHLDRFGTKDEQCRWESLMAPSALERHVTKLLDPAETTSSPDAPVCPCHSSTLHLVNSLPEEVSGSYNHLFQQMLSEQIKQWLDTDYDIVILGDKKEAVENAKSWLKERGIQLDRVHLDVGLLPCGIVIPGEKLVLLPEKEIFSVFFHSKRRHPVAHLKCESATPRDEHENFADLEEGDYAVHLTYGIGVYRGIREIENGDTVSEVIAMEYADEVEVFVPLTQARLVSRYMGTRRSLPPLSKIGGTKWAKMKTAASEAVQEMAADMLRLQAMRIGQHGHSFPEDDSAQRSFDESFPFPDTPDQTRVSSEIKLDMEKERPMDRLLCGDVGYGKTEVAMRAVFKCVMTGKQVAVLVPTTILAQQHYYTFMERFAEYPIMIETLSRFKTPKEQHEIIKKIATGGVDIIIGTHRLVQKDVRFQDLGLAIIDEEQRFGVEHKERLKRLRASVDILTMTATPIPRTLYMSMTGVRDLSTLVTAPNMRLPVHTVVCQKDESVIQNAIEREVKRGGQVYYLHNRVDTIEDTCDWLRRMIPGVSFALTHGRMPENELESVMSRFIEGGLDVLVTTTIIESGLDIPNANTIIIERADRFGLAELYQLRGRVGRWTRQAYAYLLLPKHNIITGDARKRIAAIRKYTQLGAGFKLALRDLEIRGAGNLLGKEQSGQINAIGFELYCQLLKNAVNELQGKSQPQFKDVDLNLDFVEFAHKTKSGKLPAAIPPDYIPSERIRLEAYRKISKAESVDDIKHLTEEFRDRYGPLGQCVETLLRLVEIKITAASLGITAVSNSGAKLLLERDGVFIKKNGAIPMLLGKEPTKKLDELESFLKNLFVNQKTADKLSFSYRAE